MLEELLFAHSEWLLFGAIGLGFGFLLLRQHLSNKAPEYIASATVESRRLGIAGFHGKYSSGCNHLVTFRLNGPETVELYVSRSEYEVLTEGLHGTLRWQNENMLSFEPQP